MLRCCAIGSILGAIPGMGAAVIDWIAYGHAARTEKGADKTFGKGDVRSGDWRGQVWNLVLDKDRSECLNIKTVSPD